MIRYRQCMSFPPFLMLTNVLAMSENLDEAQGWGEQIGTWLKANPNGRSPGSPKEQH